MTVGRVVVVDFILITRNLIPLNDLIPLHHIAPVCFNVRVVDISPSGVFIAGDDIPYFCIRFIRRFNVHLNLTRRIYLFLQRLNLGLKGFNLRGRV